MLDGSRRRAGHPVRKQSRSHGKSAHPPACRVQRSDHARRHPRHAAAHASRAARCSSRACTWPRSSPARRALCAPTRPEPGRGRGRPGGRGCRASRSRAGSGCAVGPVPSPPFSPARPARGSTVWVAGAGRRRALRGRRRATRQDPRQRGARSPGGALETRRGRLDLAAAHLARAQPVVAGATCGRRHSGPPGPLSRSPTAAPRTSARFFASTMRRTPVIPSSFFPSTRTRRRGRAAPHGRVRAATKRPSERRSVAPRHCWPCADAQHQTWPALARAAPTLLLLNTDSASSRRLRGHEPSRTSTGGRVTPRRATRPAGRSAPPTHYLREAEAALAAALPRPE